MGLSTPRFPRTFALSANPELGVRATHAALDPVAEAALRTLYRRTIGLGAHPNERGVLAATTRTETPEIYAFEVAYLTNRPLLIVLALKSAVEAAVGALKTFRLIFSERFAISGLDGDVDKLVAALNSAFSVPKR
jgi:hypothetical protein